MSLERCDEKVFKYGKSLGMYPISKSEAEELCKLETKRTGMKHDWHYVGGRVHIKYLENTEPPTEETR